MPPHHTLTPADILILRTARPPVIDLTDVPSVPHIIYLPAEDAFVLIAYRRPQCVSQDAAILAQCLRCERAEPGFIRRILSSAEAPDVASLDPASRLRHQARQREEAAKQRLYAEERAREAQEAAQRLRYVPKPTVAEIISTDLDDLLS